MMLRIASEWKCEFSEVNGKVLTVPYVLSARIFSTLVRLP